jgi:hypothetical protein
MKFEEIFNKPGLYIGDNFVSGFCFEVDGRGVLMARQYKASNDPEPDIYRALVYKGLFAKNYRGILNTKELFPNE